VLSSSANHYVQHPFDWRRFGPTDWRFTFLQHGVTKDDLSRWLNRKSVDLLVTSTVDEHASIVSDGTRYKFTSREVQRTGLPRHDALLAKAAQVAPEQRTLLTIAPTWRESLLAATDGSGGHRALGDGIADSRFVEAWTSLLASQELESMVERAGLEIVLLMHPNMSDTGWGLDVPDHVRRLSYADDDVQDILARTALLVTDYSSLSFEAAVIGTGVAHYQFDADDFFTSHTYQRGYFDYETAGFGPVATSEHDLIKIVSEFVDHGCVPDEPYVGRMAAAFDRSDGGCCERVYEAVLAMDRPAT
jgi:CDP-glycerol glycerophosphotransferase (TagB/SpsB family)